MARKYTYGAPHLTRRRGKSKFWCGWVGGREVSLGTPDRSEALKRLEQQFGLKLANGQDSLKGKIWRLAHMGYIDQFEVLSALGGLELVLHQMGFKIEPGVGVAAFQKAMAAL